MVMGPRENKRPQEGRWRFTALAALVGILFASCTNESDGLTIDLYLEGARTTNSGTLEFTTDRGLQVVVDRGWLATGAIELRGCTPTSWRFPFRIELFPRAYAHATSSPTKVGVPFVESLVDGGERPQLFGRLTPPPDRYCTVVYSLLPADADAAHLPAAIPFIGKTLYVSGTYRVGPRGDPQHFEAWSNARFEAAMPFPEIGLGPDQMVHAALTIRKDTTRWFDGLDLSALTPDDVGLAVLAHLRDRLSVQVR